MAIQTLADYFDPGRTLLQAQQIKNAQAEQQLTEMKLAEARRQEEQSKRLQSYLSGTEQPTLLTALDQSDPITGQQKINKILPQVQAAFAKDKIDPQEINRLQVLASDPDVKAAVKIGGFDDVSFGYDEKTKKAWQRYTKDYSQDDLNTIADKVPGGKILKALPAGKYTIEYDPINRVIVPRTGDQASIFADKNLTENELIARASAGDPAAQKALEARLQFEKSKADVRYGTLDQATVRKIAEESIPRPEVLNLVPSRGNLRPQILQERNRILEQQGIALSDVAVKQGGFKAAQKSYEDQVQKLDSDQRTATEFFGDVDRVIDYIKNFRSNYPAYANVGIRKLRELSGTKELAGENVLRQELDDLRNSYSRITKDATGSVAEMSQSTQKIMEQLINSDSPAFALVQQLEAMKRNITDKISARKKVADITEKRLGSYMEFEAKKGRLKSNGESSEKNSSVINTPNGSFTILKVE
jgi:hypothetical protein